MDIDPEEFKHWTPSAQEKALEIIRQTEMKNWRPFYCKDALCDGRPHIATKVGPTCPGDIYGHWWREEKGKWVCDEEFGCGATGHAIDSWTFGHARADQRPPPWQDRWRTWAILSGRGTGKALALDTPLPTPSGWTTMGDVSVGDCVLDALGEPTVVTFATEVQYERECYRVRFSDGATVVADAEHLWVTSTHRQRKQGYRNGEKPDTSVITTSEMLATLMVGSRGDRNHCVWLAEPLDLPEAQLPVDPYTLGAWLGDGNSHCARITIHDDDVAEMDSHLGESLGPGVRVPGANCATYPIGVRESRRDSLGRMTENGSLHSRLRELGVLGNKHVPAIYLRGSIQQRRDLLAGLMDTDGHADRSQNSVEFCSTRLELAEGVAELARSLGQKATLREGTATLDGVVIGPKYRTCWRPDESPFRLARKQSRLDLSVTQGQRSRQRMIVGIDPIESVPVRCITVDSPTSTYLCGNEMVPTHNTETGARLTHRIAEKVPHIILIGATGPDLRETMVEGPSGIMATAPPDRRPEWEPSKKKLTFPNGAIARGFSAEEPDRLRGPQSGYVWLDEPAHYDFIEDVWHNLLLGLRLGNPSHILATSTPLPTKWMKALVEDPKTILTKVATYANLYNLDPEYRTLLLDKYEGTRLGKQELHGDILGDVEGALWEVDFFSHVRKAPPLDRIVVAVDPAGSANNRSDETGIIVVGIVGEEAYVLADYTGVYSPHLWGRKVWSAYEKWSADAVVAEKNFGGDMVQYVIDTSADETLRVKTVQSRRGKAIRAEPIVAQYERGRVHHVQGGDLAELEDEQLTWVPGQGPSPNRVDALVHGLTDLFRGGGPSTISRPTQVLARSGGPSRGFPWT